MSYNSNRGNYNNNPSSNYSTYSSYDQSGSYVPSSRRTDGSYREEIRVRPGFVPEAEKQSYAPPAARSSYSSTNNKMSESKESLEDRVDSWAEEDAPVINEGNRTTETKITKEVLIEASATPVEDISIKEVVITAETKEHIHIEEAEVVENDSTSPAREPRKPSQLATAIDTALDSLSIGSPSSNNETSSTRQIGRFAAQIANEEREGRTYRRYDGYSNNYNNNNSTTTGSGYYNRDNSQGAYNRPYNNWNRSGSSGNGPCKEPSTEETNGIASNSSETRVESEFKTFLDQLTVYRREMAVINAKLEYIKYVKSRDMREMTEVERERLTSEAALVSRLDSIFESIDSLSRK